jgi:hypothetical protein
LARRVVIPEPTAPQGEFFGAAERFRAFIGGVGSGKTWAGVIETWRQPGGSTGMVLAPTYPMLRDATLRTFLDMSREAGILGTFHKSEYRAELINGTTILFRSADDPERLRGPNLGWFWPDEAALMDVLTWKIMLGRLRLAPGKGWITTTPRGKNWLHREFTTGGNDYRIVKASSKTNFHLPAEFVGSLERSYSDLFRRQEVEGEFVDDQVDALIPGDWLDACCDAPHVRGGHARIAVDLGGGSDGDRTVILCRDDNGILDLRWSRDWTLETTATQVSLVAQRFTVASSRVTFDQMGIGFDFNNRLQALGIRGALPYQGGASGGAKFSNLRTAAGWGARQRLDPTTNQGGRELPRFAIRREWLDLIRDELVALRWTVDNDRKIALEKKDDLVANLGHSPDFADVFCQSFGYPNV